MFIFGFVVGKQFFGCRDGDSGEGKLFVVFGFIFGLCREVVENLFMFLLSEKILNKKYIGSQVSYWSVVVNLGLCVRNMFQVGRVNSQKIRGLELIQ